MESLDPLIAQEQGSASHIHRPLFNYQQNVSHEDVGELTWLRQVSVPRSSADKAIHSYRHSLTV